VTARAVAGVTLLAGDGRRDSAVGEVMEADVDSKPLGGTHGAADLGLAWCHGDSDSLQHTVGVEAPRWWFVREASGPGRLRP
jgi:hypothetical protein